MIVAIPVDNDKVDVHDLAKIVDDGMVLNGWRDADDDSQDASGYEDVAALLDDLGVKVPRWMHDGRNARVKVEHNAQVVGGGGREGHPLFVRVNAGDVVVIDHWQKAFNSYAVKVPTGQTCWIDKSDLVVE